MSIPRPEYPRPQLMRENWLNLNGEWEFQMDQEKSGQERELFKAGALSDKITVPFCPESKLSGIGFTDFIACVWYKKKITLPKSFQNKEVLLHFGAVDYHAFVYVNGELAGEHRGGYSSFCLNITKYLKDGENDLTVCAYDDVRSGNQPAGKQSAKLKSYGCFYTRTTGIWQTVWMEAVEESYIQSVNYLSDPENAAVTVQVKVSPASVGKTLTVSAAWDKKPVGTASAKITACQMNLTVQLSETHLWDVGEGNLYDTELSISDGASVLDEVQSYFGLRSVGLGKRAFYLNGRPVFGRWVLDQGFYPDGIYTAPSEDALRADVENSMKLGFNGARLHEKMFEPRFLYWADKLGYLVWGEHANWGLDITEPGQIMHFLPEWIEGVERDMAHPSIIGWCPLNETWDKEGGRRQCDDVLRITYLATKAIDPTRPVIDTSGNFHVITDIYDVHDYEQDPQKFSEYYSRVTEGIVIDQTERMDIWKNRQKYQGEPFFVSEYGGIYWNTEDKNGWGYGNAPEKEKEFLDRYDGLTTSLLENPYVLGFCYTQLYDVEQEKNGLMTYDRKFKFDPEIIRKINQKKAAIEEE